MIMELTTTSLGLAMGFGSASVLTGSSSSMDSIRRFFLSERSRIDDIISNSQAFEDEYGLNEKVGSDEDITPSPSNNPAEDDSPSSVLGSTISGVGYVVTEGVKSWFKFRYLVCALVLGFAYKLIKDDSRGVVFK